MATVFDGLARTTEYMRGIFGLDSELFLECPRLIEGDENISLLALVYDT